MIYPHTHTHTHTYTHAHTHTHTQTDLLSINGLNTESGLSGEEYIQRFVLEPACYVMLCTLITHTHTHTHTNIHIHETHTNAQENPYNAPYISKT